MKVSLFLVLFLFLYNTCCCLCDNFKELKDDDVALEMFEPENNEKAEVLLDLSIENDEESYFVSISNREGTVLCDGNYSSSPLDRFHCSYKKELLNDGDNTLYVSIYSYDQDKIVMQTVSHFMYGRSVDFTSSSESRRKYYITAGVLFFLGYGYNHYRQGDTIYITPKKDNFDFPPPKPPTSLADIINKKEIKFKKSFKRNVIPKTRSLRIAGAIAGFGLLLLSRRNSVVLSTPIETTLKKEPELIEVLPPQPPVVYIPPPILIVEMKKPLQRLKNLMGKLKIRFINLKDSDSMVNFIGFLRGLSVKRLPVGFWRAYAVVAAQGLLFLLRRSVIGKYGKAVPQNAGAYEYFIPFEN